MSEEGAGVQPEDEYVYPHSELQKEKCHGWRGRGVQGGNAEQF